MAFCSNCGYQLSDDARFCVKCGKPVDTVEGENNHITPPPIPQTATNQQSPTPPPAQQIYIVNRKSKGVALILCLFFGGIGIHDFYLGRYISGTLSVLFCWTFIPLLWSFVDFFIILFTPESVFHKMYDK